MNIHPCQDKCPNFTDENCCHCLVLQPIIETKEIIFDAEKWLYERKSAYPMVDCIPMPGEGLWRTFDYHPVCHGITLQNQDVITLDAKGNYTVKPKDSPVLQNADEAKHYSTYLEATRYAP